jgi:hypothetical protein
MGTAQLSFEGDRWGPWRHRKLHHRKWHHRNRKSWTGNGKWKGDHFPRFFYPYFPRFFLTRISRVFPGTPLDSRYEQWNCESNLYRVTIDLLPPMLNHFPSWFVQSAVINWLSGMCMQYMTAFSMFFCLFVVFVNKMLFIIRGFTL